MRFRHDIQGLRALAVLLVVAHHYFPETLTGGYLGVDVFFVISGYIITQVLIENHQTSLKEFLMNFYARRVRRILPLAILVVSSSTLITYLLLGSVTGGDTARDGIFASLFIANIHFSSMAVDYFSSELPRSILQHYWSLAIEEQFYLVWPAIFFLTNKKGKCLVVVFVASSVSFTYALVQTLGGSITAYLSTGARLWELGLGAALAISPFQRNHIWVSNLSVTFLLILAFTFTPSSNFPGFPALVVNLLTVLTLVTGGTNRILSSRVLTWIGDRSYTIYLLHWPIIQIVNLYKSNDPSFTEKLILLGLLFVLSALIFRHFENPIRYSAALRSNSTRTVGTGLGLILTSVALLSAARGIL